MDRQTIQRAIKELKEQAILASDINGGGYSYYIISMLYCWLRYGARPKDYNMFKFYRLRGGERNKFITLKRHQKMMAKMNKIVVEGKYHIVDKKEDEYMVYKNFIQHEFLILKPEDNEKIAVDFINSHDVTIVKPTDSTFGRGVMKIRQGDENAIKQFLLERQGHTYIIEECLRNCDELKNLNPTSLNTIRAFTHIDSNGHPEIVTIQLRVGTPGMIVDNWGAGGVVYNVDVDKGVIDRAGLDKTQKTHLYHPGNNVKMIGFEIPKYQQLTDYILTMAKVVPQAKVVGWDIAITDKGVDFIEMNCPGGHDIMQAYGTPYYDKYLH